MPLALDIELIENARRGGEDLDRLIAAVWPEAYRIAQSILFDSGLAEDAAQEACATIAISLPGLKHIDRFAAWSYRIIVNGALMTARRRPRTQALDALVERGFSTDASQALDIQSALATLPSVQRAAIVLHYYAGFNSGEIAAATGLVPSTVRFYLMLARRALRKVLTGTFASHSSEEVLPHVH